MTAVVHNCKYAGAISPQIIKDNAAWTATEVDTLGWDYAEFIGLVGATDIAMASFTIGDSDTSGSGHSAYVTFGTTVNIDGSASELPAAGDDDTLQAVQVDLRGRKRYHLPAATAGNGTAGTYFSMVCRLSRGEQMPNTVAEAGCDELIRI